MLCILKHTAGATCSVIQVTLRVVHVHLGAVGWFSLQYDHSALNVTCLQSCPPSYVFSYLDEVALIQEQEESFWCLLSNAENGYISESSAAACLKDFY